MKFVQLHVAAFLAFGIELCPAALTFGSNSVTNVNNTNGSGFSDPGTSWSGNANDIVKNITIPTSTETIVIEDVSSGVLTTSFLSDPDILSSTLTLELDFSVVGGVNASFDIGFTGSSMFVTGFNDITSMSIQMAFGDPIATAETNGSNGSIGQAWGAALRGLQGTGVTRNDITIDMLLGGLMTDPELDGTFVAGDSGLDLKPRQIDQTGNGIFGNGLFRTFPYVELDGVDLASTGAGIDRAAAYFLEQDFTIGAPSGQEFVSDTIFRFTFDGSQPALVSPIPEPSSFLFLMSGGLFFGFSRRRKSK